MKVKELEKDAAEKALLLEEKDTQLLKKEEDLEGFHKRQKELEAEVDRLKTEVQTANDLQEQVAKLQKEKDE